MHSKHGACAKIVYAMWPLHAGNIANETIYGWVYWDSKGKPLTGANGNAYTITFDPTVGSVATPGTGGGLGLHHEH